MIITRVAFSGTPRDEFLTYVTVTLDDKFAINGIKILRRKKGGRMICMPDRQKADGSWTDVAHPINADARRDMENHIYEEYDKHIERVGVEAQ